MKNHIQKSLLKILIYCCFLSFFEAKGAKKSFDELRNIRDDLVKLTSDLKDEKKYNYVSRGMIVLLDDTERIIDAISGALLAAIFKKSCPIITSASLLKNIFAEYNNISLAGISATSLKTKARNAANKHHEATPDEVKYHKYALIKACGFQDSDWVIKKISSELYLLLPGSYLDTVGVNIGDVKDDSLMSDASPIELRLGLKVNHMKTVDIDYVRKDTSNEMGNFLKFLGNIFCMRSDYKDKKDVLPIWSFYMGGHGEMERTISGLPLDDFRKVLEFLEYKINTRLLFYSTCYAGGATAEKLYKDAKSNVYQIYSFAVITQVMTDSPAETLIPTLVFKENGDELTLECEEDFVGFFKEVGLEIIDYAKAVEFIVPLSPTPGSLAWANVPQIKLPGIEWFSSLESPKEIVSIGSILAKTQAEKGALNISKRFGTKPRAILLYAQDIPFELIIDKPDKMEAIISMVLGNATHTIEKISTFAKKISTSADSKTVDSKTVNSKTVLDWFMKIDRLATEKTFFIKQINYDVDEAIIIYRKTPGNKFRGDTYITKAFYRSGGIFYAYNKDEAAKKATKSERLEYESLIKTIKGEVQKIDTLELKEIDYEVRGLTIQFDGLYEIDTIEFKKGTNPSGHLGILFDGIKDKMGEGSILLVKEVRGGYASGDMAIAGLQPGDAITITNVIFDKQAGVFFTYNGKFYRRNQELAQDYLPEYRKKMSSGNVELASSGITAEEIGNIRKLFPEIPVGATKKKRQEVLAQFREQIAEMRKKREATPEATTTSPLQEKLQKTKSKLEVLKTTLTKLTNVFNNLKTKLGDAASPITLPPKIITTTPLPPRPASLVKQELPKELVTALKDIGGTKRLYLDVGNLEELPEEIFQLINLEALYINGASHGVTKSKVSKLPSDIANLKNLKELDILYCSLEYLPNEIGDLSNLERLNLNYNKLQELPEKIIQLKKLKELKLMFNDLIGLPKDIETMTQLTELVLVANKDIPQKERLRIKAKWPKAF